MDKTNDNEQDQILDAAGVAEYLGFKVSRIRYETFLNRIPHIKLGRSVRYSKLKIDEWIKENSVPPIGKDSK
jgi:predicted DNA-binding transcriptional regulator AlpA